MFPGNGAILTKRFCAVVKTHKRRSNKIYKSELTKIKIENQVKYRVDPQRTRLTFIVELTWSNLGLKEVLMKFGIQEAISPYYFDEILISSTP